MITDWDTPTAFWDALTAISTCFGLLGLLYQYWRQNKIDKFELVMNLYRELFLNDKFMRILKVIDKESLIDRNKEIQRIIDDEHCINAHDNVKISESDLVSFLNFFNSLAILTEKKVLLKSDILDVFQYQIEKLFTTIVLLKYIEEYQFDRIKKIAPDVFFFYGSLSDGNRRNELYEINEIRNSLFDVERNVKLDDYVKKDNVRPDQPYPVIKKSIGKYCRGNLVKIYDKASWYEVFKGLDDYEEVVSKDGIAPLYSRRILKLETGHVRRILHCEKNRYVWAYVN